jgi:NAD(P)H-hydrate epimerase
VGPGNNGGDGLITARHLARWGAVVTAFVPVERREPDLPAVSARAFGCDVLGSNDVLLPETLDTTDLIIDALLGTGRGRAIDGPIAATLGRVKRSKARVISVDVPTGVDADTGDIDPITAPADVTVVLGRPKIGLFQPDVAPIVGRLQLAEIGLPEEMSFDGIQLIEASGVRTALPQRTNGGHKGSFGRAVIVGGSRNYVGAPALAGRGAARVGAGLVTLATPASVSGRVSTMLPEATHILLRERGHPEDAGLEDTPMIAEIARDSDALIFGPGLGSGTGARRVLRDLLRHPTAEDFTPIVLDADALNILAESDGWHSGLPSPVIVTPHPGEMARLSGTSISDIQANRPEVARESAARWGVTVVLKGAFTVVAHPDGRVAISSWALPALGSAGTGDVLAGAIGGLLAQGVSPFEAACSAVYLHGAAGVLAANSAGDPTAGLLAGDLADRLPAAMGAVRRGEIPGGAFA